MQSRIRPIPSPSKHPKKSHQILETPKNKRPQQIPLQTPKTPSAERNEESLFQLVLRLTGLSPAEISLPQHTHTFGPHKLSPQNKYITHWTNTITWNVIWH